MTVVSPQGLCGAGRCRCIDMGRILLTMAVLRTPVAHFVVCAEDILAGVEYKNL